MRFQPKEKKKMKINANVINECKITFLSKSKNESFSRMVTSGMVCQLNPLIDELSDIKTAVSEAVTNSIVHAYKSGVGKIDMLIRLYDNKTVYIRIKDYGCGIEDIDKAREPLFTTAPEQERAGLGFAVMESFMDKLEVKSVVGKGTTVTMVKRLSNTVTA